jgi:hypothetical protein
MFHYLPMYNKFRTVEMALVIPGMVFPIIAIWGLKELFCTSNSVFDGLMSFLEKRAKGSKLFTK